ncbi:MAG: YbjQ family protein [Phycisphaerae bacterium]|nr:YbjQ family protein [Phycisphaerae bacterium]
MPVTTTFAFEGQRITKYLGVVRGVTVRAPTIVQGITGGLKSIVGGRIGAYATMCDQARQQAYDAMVQHAREIGANAVVGMRYDASDVGSATGTEVICYGTAVVVETRA